MLHGEHPGVNFEQMADIAEPDLGMTLYLVTLTLLTSLSHLCVHCKVKCIPRDRLNSPEFEEDKD